MTAINDELSMDKTTILTIILNLKLIIDLTTCPLKFYRPCQLDSKIMLLLTTIIHYI